MSQQWDDKEVVWDKRGQREKGQTREQQVNKAIRTGSGAIVMTEKKFGSGGNAAGHATSGMFFDLLVDWLHIYFRVIFFYFIRFYFII
jgi:hypothetical protein